MAVSDVPSHFQPQGLNTPQSPPFMRGYLSPLPMESPIPYPPFFPPYSYYRYNPYTYNPQPQFHQPQPSEEQLEALVHRVISEQSVSSNSTVTAPVTTYTIAAMTMTSGTPQLLFPGKGTLVFILDLWPITGYQLRSRSWLGWTSWW